VLGRNDCGKGEVEFARRRLALPLKLAPGEVRQGSGFFPMVPAPR